jgi:DNA-binding transcriptional LysR family regulator
MRLTPEGARLLPLAEASLRGLAELDRHAGLPAAPPGELRLGSGDALGRELLPAALTRLTARHPDVEVYLREGPRPRLLQALRSGEIDVALVVGDPQRRGEEGLDVEPWLDSRIQLLAPPGALRERSRTTLERLAGRRLVVLQRGSAFRRHLEAAFDSARIPFRPAIEVGNLSLVRRFVAAGLGVAPVPAIAFGSDVASSAVQRLELRGLPALRYARALRPGAPLPDVARDLLELLRDPI